MTSRQRAILGDVLVSAAIYVIAHWVARGSVIPPHLYLWFGACALTSWVGVSAYLEKYRFLAEGRSREALSATLWVAPIVLGTLSALAAVTPLWQVARSFVLLSVAALALGTPVVAAICNQAGVARTTRTDLRHGSGRGVVPWRVLAGAATAVLSVGMAAWLKTGSFVGYPLGGLALLVVFQSWAVSAAVTRKYGTEYARQVSRERVVAHLKSIVLMLLAAGTVFLMFRLDELSRWMLFGSPLLFGLLEIPLVLFAPTSQGRVQTPSSGEPSDATMSAHTTGEPIDSPASNAAIEHVAGRLAGLDSRRAVGMRVFLVSCRESLAAPTDGSHDDAGLALAAGNADDIRVQGDRSLPLLANLRPFNPLVLSTNTCARRTGVSASTVS